jgi:hypothetical protein
MFYKYKGKEYLLNLIDTPVRKGLVGLEEGRMVTHESSLGTR